MVRNAMSATEFYILQYLWTRETPATFSEIMVHFNETEQKEWKKQEKIRSRSQSACSR